MSKLTALVDKEMERVGAVKVSMPSLLSASPFRETGRWQSAGKEMWRVKDRKGSEFCLAPTHEEIFTTLAASTISSASELPLTLYQIGPKYRDEARPRFGLLRGREFLMKDAYSFHATEEDALRCYDEMDRAYRRIFERLGRPFVRVDADGGAIGDHTTHEFQMLADIGEDTILSCDACGYAANEEQAARSNPSPSSTTSLVVSSVLVSSEEGGPFSEAAKLIAASDREPNTIRIQSCLLGQKNFENEPPLFLKVVVEDAVDANDLLGAHDDDDDDASLLLVDDSVGMAATIDRSATLPGSFTMTKAGDSCDHCTAPLIARKGIEVGQIFYLGQKYSSALGATFGDEKTPMFMGCYGIGVSRILAALVETVRPLTFSISLVSKNSFVTRIVDPHDAQFPGISDARNSRMEWPAVVAPYAVNVVTSGSSPRLRDVASDLCERACSYDALEGEVVLDDRWSERLGMKLTESELVGYPITIIVGRTYERDGVVEVRAFGETSLLGVEDTMPFVNEAYRFRFRGDEVL